ncbi:class V lanthionine synthetase subunit LxmK [Streptomyces sp. NBC_01185]|uniref:class V lanthionine synthetase subunit LxmK n=1 Tax=Streptomyces sp. NBC_01185 TaxID=2903764 RepID=UPI00387075BC|nr:class V lanthionine synthetase subunit LxmK [Streptomyces sp. NBC_01185]
MSMVTTSAPAADDTKFQEANAFLVSLGLGTLAGQPDSKSLPGRNTNVSGTTDTGHGVFVKRLEGASEVAETRIQQCLTFERLLRRYPETELSSPRCLGSDLRSQLMVFELVEDATTAADLVKDGKLTEKLARSLGNTVGRLHNLPADELRKTGPRTPLLPSAELLEGLPVGLFEASSAAELQVWNLLHNDVPLADALQVLLEKERKAEPVAAHCDLRLDQFLVAGGRVHLTDLEEFQAGDAARDLGGVVGDLLHRAVLEAATSESPERQAVPSREHMLEQVASGIRVARPHIQAFWNGYLEQRPADSTLAARVVAFTGWHLLDRLLAGARTAPRLAALPRAAAGIGRRALLTPEKFILTLGLEVLA